MDNFFIDRKTDSELTILLNLLDCESRLPFACAVDRGPGDLFVSVFSRGLKFCERNRAELRTDNGHAILREARRCAKEEQRKTSSGTRQTSLQPAWVPSMGAIEVANRLVERRIRTSRGRLEQVLNIELRRPLASWNMARQRSGEHFLAHADEVRIARSMQLQSMQHPRRRSKTWLAPRGKLCPRKQTKLMEPRFPRRHTVWTMVQKHGPHPG